MKTRKQCNYLFKFTNKLFAETKSKHKISTQYCNSLTCFLKTETNVKNSQKK